MIYLVDVDAWNGTEVITLRFSSDGYTTRPTDTPANTMYDPRIDDPGNFQRFLFGEGTTRGASQMGAGDILLISSDPGNGDVLDPLLSYGFDGRALTIRMVANSAVAFSSATILFRGTAKQLAFSDPIERLALQLHDRLSDLDKPLLTARYLGTTTSSGPTAEGDVNLKDQVKPRVYGEVSNVPGVQTNAFDLIYQFSDSPVQSLVVCDGAFPLDNAGDFASIALLQAWTQIPGKYATCLAAGSARLGAKPGKAVTADVVEGANSAARTAAQIARRMLLAFGISSGDLPSGSFADLDAINPAVCGIYINDDRTALDATHRVLDSIGGWITPDELGMFHVGRLDLPSGPSVETFGEGEELDELELLPVLDEGRPLPSWRTTIKWGKIGLVQGQEDSYDAVSTARRSLVASEWRETKIEDTAVQTAHPAAVEIVIESCLAYEADAIAEATRRQAMYGSALARYRFKVPVATALLAQIGLDITLMQDRLGLDAGQLFTIIGRIDEYKTGTVTLDVFGEA